MAKQVHEAYPEIWHYTTAIGLQAIISNNTLRATNIYYLNDGEELSGFFGRRLPLILQRAARAGLEEAAKDENKAKRIAEKGGLDKLAKEMAELFGSGLRVATLNLGFYVVCFCWTEQNLDAQDGLLSQWRGYGTDGGYALVFDSRELNSLLSREVAHHHYAYAHFGDVDYFDGSDELDRSRHEETVEWEKAVHDTVVRLILSEKLDKASEALYDPILSLASRHKHSGFREEREVRFSVVVPDKTTLEGMQREKPDVLAKKVQFSPRNGTLIPHLLLFQDLSEPRPNLPIKRIVVGPHPERAKRRRAVEMFVQQQGLKIEVVESRIPFLGL